MGGDDSRSMLWCLKRNEEVKIRLFAWKSGEPVEAIDALEPNHTYAIKRC